VSLPKPAPPHEVTVYAPVRQSKRAKLPPHEPHPGESAAVTAWRVRMGTPEAKEIYKERAATAECVNADVRNHGLYQFLVRGLRKVRAVALWSCAQEFSRILIHSQAQSVGRALPACLASIRCGWFSTCVHWHCPEAEPAVRRCRAADATLHAPASHG